MISIGIDPGITGAIATYNPDTRELRIYPLPTCVVDKNKVEIDPLQLEQLLNDIASGPRKVTMEKVGTQPTWGSKQCFSFGHTVGIIQTVIKMLYIPYTLIRPQEWKKVLAGTDKSKEAAIAYITRLFPGVNLIPEGKDNPSHDFAEAAILALYGAQ